MSVRTSSSSSSSSDAGFEEVKSPRKLQRSIWNQVMAPQAPDTNHSSAPSSSSLSLRSLDLTLPPTLPAILLHCQPHASHIHSLDIGYSLLSADSLPLLLPTLPCLEELLAVKCGLVELNITTQWPDKLKVLDLSRNKLRCFPQGMDRLLHLKKVNLSGNLIREVDPSVLRLPQLDKLYLLSNPIANIPKVVCREGVLGMRQYFKVEPLTTPGSNSSTSSFLPPNRRASFDRVRNVLLHHSESAAESGYDSSAKLASTSTSCSSLNNLENEEGEEMEEGGLSLWPRFCQRALPDGYTEVCEASLCQVYLPEGCRQNISVDIVKDVSLHPRTRPNELLITPVIRISPHGLTFDSEKPAILVLSHCTKPSGCIHRLVPLCSSTAPSQPPVWERMAPTTECEIFKNCVMFTATHFSLFAVVSVLPYPTAAAQIDPNDGGTLFVPDFPGFSVRFPANCIVSPDPSTSVQATVYYTDLPYCLQNALAQASASVGLEPHGIQFTTPVHVTIPVPDYTAIMATFRGAYLQLWYSPYDSDGLFDWELVEDAAISVSDSPNGYVATFSVSHFSLFELLWSVCRETVTRLGYGAGSLYQHLSSRASYVSVRCQVFMSPPLPDLSFGLLVTVYKFGEPLSDLSNYRWLLADTGSKHVFLRTGEVAVVLDGHFSPRSDLGESEELRREAVIDFSGQDFCLRFEFALRLREEVGLPLQDHQLLGKLRVGPPNGSAPIDLNLIKVDYSVTLLVGQILESCCCLLPL